MSRRRTRYIALAAKRPNQVEAKDVFVMAYSLEGARNLLDQNGMTYEKVTTYAAYQKALARIENRNAGGYRLDQRAINEAIDYLGLKLPVRVRFSSRAGSVRGNYRLGRSMAGPNFHNIMLKTYIGAEQASKTLWHELTHAMQAEREILAAGQALTDPAGKLTWQHADARGRGRSYKNKPIEVEAREGEAMHEACPLAVAR